MAGTDFSHLTTDELIKGIKALDLPDYIRSKAYGVDVREILAQMTEMTIQLGVNMGLSPDDALAWARKLQDLDAQLAHKAEGKDLEAERRRIDQLVAPAPGVDNAETADIRVGHDGQVYDSAGTAVREQVSDIHLKQVGNYSIQKEVRVEWEIGGVAGATGEERDQTDRIRNKGFISGLTITANPSNKDGGRMTVVRYTKDGVFIDAEIQGYTGSHWELSSDYNYRIVYAFNDPIEDANVSGADFVFYATIEPFKIQDNAIRERHLSNELKSQISGSLLTNKFMHISSDDVINIFKDIKTNAYASIFNNPILAFLKTMNDSYGMKFSGYCFYQTTDLSFNLSQMPNTYATEFEANADWLKFGAHYLDNNGGNFGTTPTSEGVTTYKNIMTELFRICGGASSLDFIPRLHNYAGSQDFVSAVRVENLGVKGFLTSEDSRQNYHLPSDKNTFMKKHDRLYDYENNLYLFSTDIRLESVSNVQSVLTSRLSDVNYASRNGDLIIFTHERHLSEVSMQQKIIDCCEFATQNNYRFDFPQNVI